MQNQFILVIASMFGFTQCSEIETADTTPVADTSLVGTWMEVRTTYATTADVREWVSTHRKTIIVEQNEDGLQFRDCLDDSLVSAAVDGEQVTLATGDYPVLELSAFGSLTAVGDSGDTEVALQRVSTSTSYVQAQLSLQAPEIDSWTELCLDTVVANAEDNYFSFRAVNSLLGLTVAMTFGFQDPVAAGLYDNIDLPFSATGTFITPSGEGSLSDPVGTLVVSESATMDFQANLTMQNSLDNTEVEINGLLEVDPAWFEAE